MIDLSIFIAPFIGLAVSLALVPTIIRIARRRSWFDTSDEPRKIHNGDIPRLGGPAMVLGFLAASAMVFALHPGELSLSIAVAGLSALALHAVGLYDDFKNLRARYKLAWQVLGSLAVVGAGLSFDVLPLPFLSNPLELGLLGKLITILWITGIANAINMIDGLDGLAGGVSLIAATSYGIILLGLGLVVPAALAFALAGAIAGFLFFNFPKASIFMGDSGSLFLGFVLAILPLLGAQDHPEALGVLPAATILAVPIFDVFAAIIRRRQRGLAIMSPDREHIHHKLLDIGLGSRQILGVIYITCVALDILVVIAALTLKSSQFYATLGVLAVLATGFASLHATKVRSKKIQTLE